MKAAWGHLQTQAEFSKAGDDISASASQAETGDQHADSIVDDAGKTIREVKVASEPEALLTVLNTPACHFKRIGLEAGPLSQSIWGRKKKHESRL